MWARHLELCLGLWLLLAPLVFGYAGDASLVATDLVCGGAVVLLSLSTHWRPMRRAHLLELVVAAGLIAAGWLSTRAAVSPAAENHLAVGLLLVMLALVPSRASQPPASWREAFRSS
jgi:hypothetical protein